ncbi:MAG: methyltransferase [Cyclobacteriaceae bacterium]
MIRTILIQIMIVALFACKPQKRVLNLSDDIKVQAELIHSDDFTDGIDNWQPEQMPGGKVYHKDGKLEVNDKAGCTVWFKQKLSGPIMIEYDAFIIKDGGEFDRVSDLNCFWMATDSDNPDNLLAKGVFRSGRFPNYDSLSLYYTGMGGHDNSKTRFRKYTGNGQKPLLPEHDLTEEQYLITPNTVKKIRLIAYEGVIQYYRNDELLFDFRDDDPYTEGHFGLRTVHNHMTLDNFKVYRLSKIEE